MIGCPFQTSYGAYIQSLNQALERADGSDVRWVGSNCGCGDLMERRRIFQTRELEFFEMGQINGYASANAVKNAVKMTARNAAYYFRAARYARLAQGCELVHFQQILNAFGSDVVFHWLRRKSAAVRVVTVHELDSDQVAEPQRNRTYNLADALIVHAEELRHKLIALGVESERIHVVRYGTDIPPARPMGARSGLVFYGGHKIMSGKGLEEVFGAMALLRDRMGEAAPRLRIHGHYGFDTPPQAAALAESMGVSAAIDWVNQISMDEMTKLYRESSALLLPFTGSFAGLPAGAAAANGLPVIATRNAGIPEHLGDCGIWVGERDPGAIAFNVEQILRDRAAWDAAAERLYRHAAQHLSWETVGAATHAVYRLAADRHAARGHAH
jgi:glycosyltransferase involved in cell wall biosynthesis